MSLLDVRRIYRYTALRRTINSSDTLCCTKRYRNLPGPGMNHQEQREYKEEEKGINRTENVVARCSSYTLVHCIAAHWYTALRRTINSSDTSFCCTNRYRILRGPGMNHQVLVYVRVGTQERLVLLCTCEVEYQPLNRSHSQLSNINSCAFSFVLKNYYSSIPSS